MLSEPTPPRHRLTFVFAIFFRTRSNEDYGRNKKDGRDRDQYGDDRR